MRIGNRYFDSLDTVYQRKLIGWPTAKIAGKKKRWDVLNQRSLAARSQPKRGNLLRDSFAGRFSQFDMVELAGETLHSRWGDTRIVPSAMDGQVAFFTNWNAPVITGWHGKPLAQTSIPDVLTQLAAARQHLVRKRTVTVRYV